MPRRPRVERIYCERCGRIIPGKRMVGERVCARCEPGTKRSAREVIRATFAPPRHVLENAKDIPAVGTDSRGDL